MLVSFTNSEVVSLEAELRVALASCLSAMDEKEFETNKRTTTSNSKVATAREVSQRIIKSRNPRLASAGSSSIDAIKLPQLRNDPNEPLPIVKDGIKIVDYKGFVDLTVENDKVNAWV